MTFELWILRELKNDVFWSVDLPVARATPVTRHDMQHARPSEIRWSRCIWSLELSLVGHLFDSCIRTEFEALFRHPIPTSLCQMSLYSIKFLVIQLLQTVLSSSI